MKTKRVFVGLGVVAALAATAVPMASYAAESHGNVDIDLQVNSTLSMTIDGGTSGTVSEVLIGGNSSLTDKKTEIVVNTNSSAGYSLTVTAPADYSLKGQDSISKESIANADVASDSVAQGWALKTDGASAWSVFPTTGENAGKLTLTTKSGVQANDKTTVVYGFKTATSTPTGKYATTLTYTATSGS